MDKWINLTALWQILIVGLLAGAGLPAVFAVGIRAVSPSQGPIAANARAELRRSPARLAAGWLCFVVVAAAIAYGLYLIVSST